MSCGQHNSFDCYCDQERRVFLVKLARVLAASRKDATATAQQQMLDRIAADMGLTVVTETRYVVS